VNLLDILAVRHKDWVLMVGSFGCPPHLREDMVQEMYLRMHRLIETPEKVMYAPGEVNTYYVYVVLRNMYADYRKVKDKVQFESVEAAPEEPEAFSSPEAEEAFDKLINAVKSEISTWHWYDSKLFTIYAESGKSMRTISKESKISISSIFNTIKNGKSRIQNDQINALYQAWKEAQSEGLG
jgi:DNA-directed RNA polymerase specialized sigma24 family protein